MSSADKSPGPTPIDKTDVQSVIQATKKFGNASAITTNEVNRVLDGLIYHLFSASTPIGEKDASEVFMRVSGIIAMPHYDLEAKMKAILVLDRISPLVTVEKMMVTNTLTNAIAQKTDYGPNALRLLARIGEENCPREVADSINSLLSDASQRYVAAASMAAPAFMASNARNGPKYADTARKTLETKSTKRDNSSDHMLLTLIHHVLKDNFSEMMNFIRNYNPPHHELACETFIRICRDLLNRCIADESGSSMQHVRTLVSCVSQVIRKSASLSVAYEGVRTILAVPSEYMTEEWREDVRNQLDGLLRPSRGTICLLAATRLIATATPTHPRIASMFSEQLSALTTHSNNMVSCYALIASLNVTMSKNEGVADVIGKIVSVMSTIPEHLKTYVLQSIMKITATHKDTHGPVLQMLAASLREEGSLELKSSVFDVILQIITSNADQRENGLNYLCEFLEDCEYPALGSKILAHVAELSPLVTVPEKYIRVIVNRLLLENAMQRTVAADALLRIATHPKVAPSTRTVVEKLLRSFARDPDDDVRDRVAIALYVLGRKEPADRQACSDVVFPATLDLDDVMEAVENGVLADLPPDAPCEVSSIETKPLLPDMEEVSLSLNAPIDSDSLGKPLLTHEHVELTDRGDDAFITCRKIIFEQCVLLELNIKNNYGGDLKFANPRLVQILDDSEDPEGQVPLVASIENMPFDGFIDDDKTGTHYVVLRPSDGDLMLGQLKARLICTGCEDEDDKGVEIEFTPHPIELLLSDYVAPVPLKNLDVFTKIYNQYDQPEHQVKAMFALPRSKENQPQHFKATLKAMLNMEAVDIPAKEEIVADLVPKGKKVVCHGLCGRFVFGGPEGVLAAVAVAYPAPDGESIVLALRVRAMSNDLCNIVVQCVD
ncbi:Coatomer subunit gamma (CopG) [Carpediemonas membranifera]|uniref:Coatomer subunit gamma (CopG) n=1 Tax=Carpediemonas membranifera TaxID=201153 RepID=A0A8J6AWD6_9EUKA|nr:Coatomer subunit gamma (CopG) [Carpediemonas membranifera]|eukprot:KAG9389943.1 Coatomer subunit gamma (CopG) [Carpediemonas membranifera]